MKLPPAKQPIDFAREGFPDKRESALSIYGSVIPFVLAEYLVEVSSSTTPSGLVFPLGFVLYWAFYFIFYKPDYLENRLRMPAPIWSLSELPATLMGLIRGLFRPKRTQRGPSSSRPHLRIARPPSQERPLPPSLLEALRTLGLPPHAKWVEIHRQYRKLAKQYHPDLNPNITHSHFRTCDSAYRRLEAAKKIYFG